MIYDVVTIFFLHHCRDGTSIILSDDVGQLYVLNTGQGESQKDAKYDQVPNFVFFPLLSFLLKDALLLVMSYPISWGQRFHFKGCSQLY